MFKILFPNLVINSEEYKSKNLNTLFKHIKKLTFNKIYLDVKMPKPKNLIYPEVNILRQVFLSFRDPCS